MSSVLDRFNILNAWWKKRKKQTNRQTKFSWIILEEARWFSTAISDVLNTMVWYWNVNYDEREWWMIPLFNLLDLFTSCIVCLFCRLFNLLGTTSSSSVQTTSKYNSSAIIFKFYSKQSGLMVSVLNPEWSRWICFLWQANT